MANTSSDISSGVAATSISGDPELSGIPETPSTSGHPEVSGHPETQPGHPEEMEDFPEKEFQEIDNEISEERRTQGISQHPRSSSPLVQGFSGPPGYISGLPGLSPASVNSMLADLCSGRPETQATSAEAVFHTPVLDFDIIEVVTPGGSTTEEYSLHESTHGGANTAQAPWQAFKECATMLQAQAQDNTLAEQMHNVQLSPSRSSSRSPARAAPTSQAQTPVTQAATVTQAQPVSHVATPGAPHKSPVRRRMFQINAELTAPNGPDMSASVQESAKNAPLPDDSFDFILLRC